MGIKTFAPLPVTVVDVTFVRTSTLLLRFEELTVLTDPWFCMQLRGLPCYQRPGIELEDLPTIDLIIASHLHPDHFDRRSLSRMDLGGTNILGPEGTARFARDLGAKAVVDMVPGEVHKQSGVTITATEADHPDGEVNFVLQDGSTTMFFGGDTKYHHGFTDIGRRFAIDVAMLPMGGSRVLGRRIVMTPAQALQAAVELGARIVVPIHEGGAWMSLPPLSFHSGRPQELEQLAREREPGIEVRTLRPGELARF